MIRIFLTLVLLGLVPAVTFADDKTTEEAGLKAYGFARLDVIYNDARFDHPQYPNYVKPVADGASKENQLDIHPRLSRLGLKTWSGDLGDGLRADGKFEIDFQNGGSSSRQLIRMRHAYGQLKTGNFSFLFGQTWQLVSRLFPSANSDSMMWNTGNTGDRAPQLRMAYHVPMNKGGFDVELAALLPNAVDGKDLDANGVVDGLDAVFPTLQGRLALAMPMWTERPLKLAVAGLYGKEQSTGDDAEENLYTSYGVFAELDLPVWSTLGIRGEFFWGQNLSDVRGGIKQGVNTTLETEVTTMGYWGELYYSPLCWLSLSGGYGSDTPDNGDLSDGDRNSNTAIWGVVSFRPVKPLRIQAEYLRWTTGTKGGTKADANRMNLHFTYFF